ncbi:hypothetical protein PIB30_084303 [Stylosanthes scabra]|uniref:Replication protein A 70 kDa DNA-binding subunit B/D first OB fold domain-containing protein n=1 Tax=Stylosanthes scabra TaxID=79078 RepID=A0ABU6RSD9_9FABA|nr:hypothetical protein [Stylosanthes scabra]
MAGTFDFLENVNTKTGHWRFQVYAVRVWKEMHKVNYKEVNSIEMVLQDIKGSRIQATIPQLGFTRHGSSVEEFKMYVISNFIVVDKKLKTRAAENKWTLTFSNRTTVEPVEEPTFPLQPFRFHNIAELLTADVLDDSNLIGNIQMTFG